MITFTELSIGTGGIAACVLCARASDAIAIEPYPLNRLAPDSLRPESRGGRGVTLVGFEPFAHPELPALIAALRIGGWERIRLRSDCGALMTSGNAEGVLEAGVSQLEAVLLGDESTHDRLTGRKGLYQAATLGIRAFTAAASTSAARTVLTGYVPLCQHNARSAAFGVAHLAALGAVAVHVDASLVGRGDEAYVIAALDTAAASGMAGFVTGWSGPVPRPQETAPWCVEVGGRG